MAVIRLYRLFAFLAGPLLVLRLRRRARNGREEVSRLRERSGFASINRPSGRLIWVHAASVGETNSVLPLIDDLLAAYADLHVLLTTGTVTSAEIIGARQKRMANDRRLIHQYAPLDRSKWVTRFLNHWRPQAAFWVESEIWPNTILACAARGLEPVMVNGRMSPRSFKRWQGFGTAARFLLGKFALLSAQDTISAERLESLGLENIAMPGNLKLDAPALTCDDETLHAVTQTCGTRPCWLAASTHPGEEEILLTAHRMIGETLDNVLTIIVPRHPERGADIAAMLRRKGVTIARRSNNELPSATTDIYLMDTLGEMGLAYRLADIAFIGGTLVPHGGQNPFEAAQLDCAILHGPHIANFESLFDDMAAKGATAEITDAATLATQVKALLNNRSAIDQMSQAAKEYSASMGGARARMVKLLAPFLEGQNG
ncbi:MAG: 3-deoxy-D-manno-octulosonic acid transferase [Alphaproteobacteria bacterium]|nr:3-deoxy-D-manno-octulosonic acid transferase [Alphaproteobacteria bacterium]